MAWWRWRAYSASASAWRRSLARICCSRWRWRSSRPWCRAAASASLRCWCPIGTHLSSRSYLSPARPLGIRDRALTRPLRQGAHLTPTPRRIPRNTMNRHNPTTLQTLATQRLSASTSKPLRKRATGGALIGTVAPPLINYSALSLLSLFLGGSRKVDIALVHIVLITPRTGMLSSTEPATLFPAAKNAIEATVKISKKIVAFRLSD